MTSQHIIRAVLFDLDGTLIDSAPDLAAAADKMRIDRGLPSIAYEKYRPMAGAGVRGMLGVAFDMTPEHHNFVAWREEFFYNYEMCLTQRTKAFVGVEELLATLDWRSFLHNDELNAVVLGKEFGDQIQAMFNKDLAASEPVKLEDWERRSLDIHLKELVARLWEYWL